MSPDQLKILASPEVRDARMVMGFSGWMDGGEVSTGTVAYLIDRLNAQPVAEIDGEDSYIFSFPGSMETAALFRPHVKIEGGLITEYQGPVNRFYASPADRVALLLGKEPNLRWRDYGECVFSLAERLDVTMIYFVGSVAGLVPHTRSPRLYASVSDERLKEHLEQFRLRFSNYEGPGSFVTYLTREAGRRGVPMASLVAEIPAYIQARSHRGIAFVARHLAGLLNLPLALEDLRLLSEREEERINEAIRQHPELAQRIRRLEDDYDNEVFDTQLDDLKDWLQQRDIRLD